MKKRWLAAAIVTLCMILAVISYYAWDVPLAYYFLGFNRTALNIAQIVTQAGDSLWYYILLLPAFLLMRFVWKNEQWSANFFYLLLCLSFSGLLNTGIKWLAGRSRPISLFDDGLFGFNFFNIVYAYETTSFPSGHTVTAFSLATAVCFLYPRWGFFVFGLAVIIGLSRVVLTSHFLSDVIAGAALGMICSLGVKYLYDRLHIDLNAKK